MTDKLSDFVEREGFKAVGSAPNADTLGYHLDQLQEKIGQEGKQFLILPRSQVRGSAPAYVIYTKTL